MIYGIIALSLAIIGLICYTVLLRGHIKWLRDDNKSLRQDNRYLREELEATQIHWPKSQARQGR